MAEIINFAVAGGRPVRKFAADVLREYGVAGPHHLDVIELSRHRQRIRRAETLADSRHDRQAPAELMEKLTAAEDAERATVPQNGTDARQQLINAAIEIRAIGFVDKSLAADDELMCLAKRRITAPDLTRLRVLLARWEEKLEQYPLCGADLVIAPLRLALAWFSRPVSVDVTRASQ